MVYNFSIVQEKIQQMHDMLSEGEAIETGNESHCQLTSDDGDYI